MSRLKRWITLILALVALILIGWNLADNSSRRNNQATQNTNEPTYTSDHSKTLVYNPAGGLNYKLVADKATHFAADQVSWFEHPVVTTYDENKVPTWSARADKARLTQDNMLYLYGHVEVNSLTKDAQLQRITTDNATVNLTTQDIASDDQVRLYGLSFNSTGMRMRGNLRNNTAQLIEKVKTNYEIQNQQQP